jgi:SAM-dependent methyltransferase
LRSDEAVWPPGWRCRACEHSVSQYDGIPLYAPDLADTISGFDPATFSSLAEIEEAHFWFVARNRLIVGLLDKFFPLAQTLLEIGCGNGAVINAMAAARRWEHLVGADLHPTGLTIARNRLPDTVELAQLDARFIPANAAFDVVGAFDTLEHIPDDEGVLRGMRRAVRPDGGVMFTVPQHPWLWSRADEVSHHQRRYGRGELEAKLRRNGFKVIFSSSFVVAFLPLMVASRQLARLRRRRSDAYVDRERSIIPFVNQALTAGLNAEVRLTLSGVRWPIGGSRVVVARPC